MQVQFHAFVILSLYYSLYCILSLISLLFLISFFFLYFSIFSCLLLPSFTLLFTFLIISSILLTFLAPLSRSTKFPFFSTFHSSLFPLYLLLSFLIFPVLRSYLFILLYFFTCFFHSLFLFSFPPFFLPARLVCSTLVRVFLSIAICGFPYAYRRPAGQWI